MQKRGLISVYDKSGIAALARFLADEGYKLLSTGGTFGLLHSKGVPVEEVSEYTGLAESLDGRVKTLHPKIYGGILGRRDDADHLNMMSAQGMDPIDVVVVNLYPFFEKSAQGLDIEALTEFIDIGGSALIRAAAKNHAHVTVLTSPADYAPLMEEWRSSEGGLSMNTRRRLAGKAFALSGAYDAAISHSILGDDEAPEILNRSYRKAFGLRYGENPHQQAAYYIPISKNDFGALSDLQQHQGKELSHNNLRDLDSAWRAVNEFDDGACVGVKHAAPCAAALAPTPLASWSRVFKADPVSIFGGIVAFNREVDEETARALNNLFLEVIAAPGYSREAMKVFSSKKTLRVLSMTRLPCDRWETLPVDGGLCLQRVDGNCVDEAQWTVPTKVKPTAQQRFDMNFAWRVVKHVKSNGIVLASDGFTAGIGSGQPNRIGAVNIAIASAGAKADGAVMASDAFFPFDDAVKAAADAGVKAVIQPGGSIRDEDSIRVCDEQGLTMVLTGRRHFRH